MNKKSPKVIEKSIRPIDDKTDFPDQKMSKNKKELGMKHFERYSNNDDDMRHEEKSYKIVDLDSVMDGTRARYGQPNRSIGVNSPPPPLLHIANPSYKNPRDYPSTPQYKKQSPMGTGTGTGTGTPSTQKSISVTTNSPSYSTPLMSSTRSYPTTPQDISSPQRELTSLNERMDLGPNIPGNATPSRTIPNNYSEYHRNEVVTSCPKGPKSPSYPSTPQKNSTSYVPEHSRNMPSSSILRLNEESPQRLNDERIICLERSRGASNYTRKQEHSVEHSEMMSPHRNEPPIENNSEENSSPKRSRAFTRNSPGSRQSSRFDYSVMKDINSTLQNRRQEENLAGGRTTINHDNEHYQKEKNKNENILLPVTSSSKTICDDDEKINKDFELRVAAAAERNRRSPTQSQPSLSHSLIQSIDTSPPIRHPSGVTPTHPTSFNNDSSRSLLRAAHSANKHLRNLTTQGPGPDPGPFPTTQHIPPVPDSPLSLPLSHVPQGREDQAAIGGQSAESSPPRGSVYRQSNKKTSDVN